MWAQQVNPEARGNFQSVNWQFVGQISKVQATWVRSKELNAGVDVIFYRFSIERKVSACSEQQSSTQELTSEVGLTRRDQVTQSLLNVPKEFSAPLQATVSPNLLKNINGMLSPRPHLLKPALLVPNHCLQLHRATQASFGFVHSR